MFGERLAILRKRKGLSQAELANLVHISPSATGMYEQGRREPSLIRLIICFSCKLSDVTNRGHRHFWGIGKATWRGRQSSRWLSRQKYLGFGIATLLLYHENSLLFNIRKCHFLSMFRCLMAFVAGLMYIVLI